MKIRDILAEQGVAEGSVNEFVDDRGGDGGGGRPDIRVKYLHGQDFLVTINGHKYSLSVSRLEMSLKDPSMYNKIYGVPGNPHEVKPEYQDARYWNLKIANATIEDVKGQRPAAEIEGMVDEIITKDHQADLAQIYNYHQELTKKDPDWWFTKYQMPKPQRASDFVKKNDKKKDDNQDINEFAPSPGFGGTQRIRS